MKKKEREITRFAEEDLDFFSRIEIQIDSSSKEEGDTKRLIFTLIPSKLWRWEEEEVGHEGEILFHALISNAEVMEIAYPYLTILEMMSSENYGDDEIGIKISIIGTVRD